MNTVINNPNSSGESSWVGMTIGIILAIILIVLFFVYALPALRNNADNDGGINLNVDLPNYDNNGGAGGGTTTP